MTLTILASGSKANCAVVTCPNGTHLMIDAGLSAAATYKGLRKAGIRPEDVAAVLVTHEHLDHVAGLEKISNDLRTPIYVSRGTFAAMRWTGFVRPRITVFDLAGEEPFYIGGVAIRRCPVPHDAAEPAAFALEQGGVRLAWATDFGTFDGAANLERFLSGADVLCVESNHDAEILLASDRPEPVKRRILSDIGHVSNEQTACYLRKCLSGTSRVVLLHLSAESNDPELCRLTAADAIGGRAELLLAGRNGGLS